MCERTCVLLLVEDIKIDGALVAYSKKIALPRESMHHHGSQLLAVVMDRWPSCRRSGSRELPKFHRSLKEWWQFTPARIRRAPPAPVWEGIAAQVTFLKHHTMAVFIVILLLTHIRPSELQALRKKDLVPPLALLLPCWSPVDRSFRNWSVCQDQELRDGPVLVNQRWLRSVNKPHRVPNTSQWSSASIGYKVSELFKTCV